MIEFRLWCLNNKEWERGEWFISPAGLLVEMKFNRLIDISNRTHLISQYTGLKDKNGKNIFEGDILGCKNLKFGIVKFEQGCFLCGADFLFNLYNDYEVVGNIYEDKI